MESNNNLAEPLVESAACEALGANTPEESAAYQRQVTADDTGELRVLDRQLRQTAARLAAASPHMKPPADLRGRLLQATAPVTFKMEDYRRATREDFRFYKWGFYAAAMFLIMGALYNIDVRGRLDQANKNIVALQQQEQLIGQRSSDAIAALVNPRGLQITLRDDQGQPCGKAVADLTTHKAVLIFPEETMPLGAHPQLTLTVDNKQVAFDTMLITAPANDIGFAVSKNAPEIARAVYVQNLKPDETSKPRTANIMGGP